MEKRKKTWKGKRISKIVAGFLALLVIINTCSNGVLWSVRAADTDDVTISISGNVITFTFDDATDIVGIDLSTFTWNTMEDTDKKAFLTEYFNIYSVITSGIPSDSLIRDISKVVVGITANPSDNTKADKLVLTLQAGWCNYYPNGNGIADVTFELKNSKFTQAGNTIAGTYSVADTSMYSLNSSGDGYDTVSDRTIVNLDISYIISPVLVTGGKCSLTYENTTSRILTKSGDKITVKFTPDEHYEITDVLKDDTSIDNFDSQLDANGAYTFTYDYDSLVSGNATPGIITCKATYGYKQTELGTVSIPDMTSNTAYQGAEYTVSVPHTFHNPSITEGDISWSLIKTDGSGEEYTGAQLRGRTGTSNTLTLKSSANNDETFKIHLDVSDGASADSGEITVSIPNAVTPADYDYYTTSDGTEKASVNSEGWYTAETYLKPAAGNSNGYDKIEEDEVADKKDYVSFTKPNGDDTTSQRSFRLVKMNGDKIEKSTAWFTPVLKVDAEAPTIDDVSCTLADDEWSNDTQTITITASDAVSGVKEVKYSLKADKSEASTATPSGGKYTFDTKESDGINPTYYIWAVDNADHQSDVRPIQVHLEYTKPEITSVTNPSNGGFVNEGHKITVVVKDEGGSDIEKITYQIPNSTAVDVPVSSATRVGDTYQFEIDTLKDSTGNYITDTNEYTFVAYDNAGNASTESKTTVHVDKVAPEVTDIVLTTPNKWEEHRLNTVFGHFANENVSITVTVKKNASLSAVNKIKLTYKDSNNTLQTIDATLAHTSKVVDGVASYNVVIELPAAGTRLVFNDITVVAIDAIGNESVATKYSTLKSVGSAEDNLLIEKIAPVITFNTSNLGNGVYTGAGTKIWVSSHRAIPYAITDADAGIYKYTKKINGTTVDTKMTPTTGKTTAISDESLATDASSESGKTIPAVDTYKYTLALDVVDNAGNTATKSCDIFVDSTAPVITSVTTTADADADGWVDSNDVTFTIMANDGTGSGVAKVMYYAVDNGSSEVPTAAKILENGTQATLSDGKYTFKAEGEQNKIYHILAIDNVGNISTISTKNVKIDLTTPSIDDFSFKVNNENAPVGINSYKYGNFENENITLTINVSDGTISSGIKSVKIYDGDTQISEGVTTVIADKVYKCNISVSKEYKNLKVEVTDEVGHVITKSISDINASDAINSNVLKLEKTAPSIDVSFSETSVKVGNDDWFDKNTGITVDVSDIVETINSGIASVNVTLQAADVAPKVMKYDYTADSEATMDKSYTLSTADIAVPADGKYEILVEVVDNAGNKSNSTKTIYVDATTPVVKNVRLFSTDNKEFDATLNMLSFGNFYNTNAIVKVYFADENASSGIKDDNILLHIGDEVVKTSSVTDEGGVKVASFTLDLAKLSNKAVKLQTEITDNVGHTTGVEPISKHNDSIKNDDIMLEKNTPDIDVSVTTPAYREKAGNVTKDWYNADVAFTANISDIDAGIRSIKSNVNTTSKVDENYNTLSAKTTEKEFTVSTINAKALDAGSGAYNLSIEVIDNANNKTQHSDTVYIDKIKPSIAKYEFSVKDYKEGSETPVVTTDYGYYFNQNVTLTVTAQDAVPSSGLAKINYRLDEAGKGNGEVKQAITSDNKISISVPKGFKGQIYTQAIDNVGNTGEWQTVQGVIREELDLHNNSSNITITPLISTDKKDGAGYDLYSVDVPVRLHVEDKMSGLRTIEWKLESAGDPDNNQSGVLQVANAVNASQLAGDGGWNVVSRENNLCTAFEKDIVVASNSNEIVITVKMTDRAGNVSQSVKVFSIDKTAPQISVSYDNNTDDDGHEGFFKEARVATVTVSERNFNPDNVKFEITNTDNVMPEMTGWVKTSDGTGNNDNTLYSMNVIYSQDGDYTFNVSVTDIVGNKDAGVDYGSSVTPTQFTIDKTVPVISLSYDNSQSYGDYYYQNSRTATISINEHNFDAARAIVTVTSKNNDGSDAGNTPSVGNWSSANDVNTANVVFDKDSNYTIAVTFTDMAGNVAQEIGEQKFCIDYVDPEITIENVEDRHAYNGKDSDGNEKEIAPVVTFKDTNLSIDNTTITLTNAAKEVVELKGSSSDPSADTRVFKLDNIEEDDIYTLSAQATDKAGRTKSISYRFSVNRNGSTYQLSDATAKMNSSYTNDPVDVVVTEINVDPLVQDEISVTLAKDNNSKELLADNDTQKNDYSLEKAGADGEWSEYTYTIRKDNFNEDGNYIVHLYSVDEATNVSQNDLEEENKKVEINFNVDKTKPDLSIVNIKEGETYGEDQRNAIISAVDNSYINELTITLNDKVVAEYSADEIKEKVDNNENIEVLVSNSTSKQKIEVMAIDAAGNSNSVSVGNFLVTSNLWARFVNNTTAVIATVATTCVVIGGGATSLVLFRRRKIGIKADK